MANNRLFFIGLACFLMVGCGGGNNSTPADNNASSSSIVASSSSKTSSSSSSSSSNSSSSSSSKANLVLHGVAAIGAPIINATVTAKCADGSSFTVSVKTNAQGEYSGEVGANALPCALQVAQGTSFLHSYAITSGVVNITPLTDLIIANASAHVPSDWYASNQWQLVESAIALAQANFNTILVTNGYGLPNGLFNPFSIAFSIGDDWDKLLDQLQAAILASGNLKSYADLLALFKDGNLNSLPKKVTADTPIIGGCNVIISKNTSNALRPELPLTQDCLATVYTGQVNFEINEGASANRRNLSVDFFAAATAGTTIKLEDGYDFAAKKGGTLSYVDNNGVWNADSGEVTIVSVTGKDYVVSLKNVHFVVIDATATNKGAFTANGTVTTKAPAATPGFSWKENGGTITKTSASASYTTQYKTIYAKSATSATIFEINLTAGTPATYTIDGSKNALAYIINSAMFQGSAGSVVITANTGGKMSGTFQATGTAAGGITSVSGTFTDIDVVP
jgi:hypothetical protein